MAKLKSRLNLTLAFIAGIFGFTNNAYAQEVDAAPKTAGSSEAAKNAAKGGSLSAGAIAAASGGSSSDDFDAFDLDKF